MHNTGDACAQKIKDRLAIKGVADFEVFVQERQGTTLESHDGHLRLFEKKQSRAWAIRLQRNAREGFSYGSDFSSAAIDQSIKTAWDAMDCYTPDENHGFSSDNRALEPQLFFDEHFEALTLSDKKQIISKITQTALNHDERVTAVKQARYEDEQEVTFIENSNGLKRSQQRTLFDVSAIAIAKYQLSEEMAQRFTARMYYSDIDPVHFGKVLAESALEQLGAHRCKGYDGPVVLRGHVMATLLRYWSTSFFADSIHAGTSYLSGKQGQLVYSPSLTLVDDPYNRQGSGCSLFDDEGVATNRTELVTQGVVTRFMTNEYWARKLRTSNTGNAKRLNITQRPSVHAHNLLLMPGTMTQEQLYSQLDSGVVVTDLLGAHTINSVNGDFSLGIAGVFIQNGRVKQALRSLVLSGNLHKLFANVHAVGSEQQFEGRYGGVSALIDRAVLTGR